MIDVRKAAIGIGTLTLGASVLFLGTQVYKLSRKVEFLAMATPEVSTKRLNSNDTSAVNADGTPYNPSWLHVQKKVKDTVVQIFTQAAECNWIEPYKTPEQSEGLGTGFFINDEGDIVTNYHVVAQATGIQMTIPSFGMERFDVKMVGASPERDLALLKLTDEAKEKIRKQLGKIPFLELGDSDTVLRSQEVLALGYPLGQSRLKSTLGIVSGRERLGYFGYIQITAPLNPGNSGGPAINNHGRVVGINSRGVMESQNVGYIIPINELKTALNDLYKVPLLRRPVLGCIFTASTPEMARYLDNPPTGGWYIARVLSNSLLQHVGFQDGDVLYQINGHDVDWYGEINVPWSEDKVSILEFLNRFTVGDTLECVVYRKGQKKLFNFKIEQRYLPRIRPIYAEFEPEATDYEVVGGMVVMELTVNHLSIFVNRCPDLVKYGRPEKQFEPKLLITHVLPGSAAHMTKILRPGEIIDEINGSKVSTLTELRGALLESKSSGFITVKTDDSFYAVLSLEKVLKQEETLAGRYFYRISSFIKELLHERAQKTEPKTQA